MSSSKKNIVICFLLILLAQCLYKKIIFLLTAFTCNFINNSNSIIFDMIGHSYMFFILFFITFVIYKEKQIDFGYHIPKFKYLIRCIVLVCLFEFFVAIIDIIFKVKASTNDIIGYLFFQFVFSGLGEEICFRSIPMYIFDRYCDGEKFLLKNKMIDISTLLSAVLFAVAHIQNHINSAIYSQIYSFIVITIAGILYGWTYRKTRSIWGSMLVHGLSNVITVSIPIIFL